MTDLLLLIHFASTWYLVGLCWMVQRVQYPLMSRVGTESFSDYEQGHVARIGPVVAPAMIIELATAVALMALPDAAFRKPIFLISAALLAFIWLSTFLIQVPLHKALSAGFDGAAHGSLVRTNWIRTLAWTSRGGILLWMLWSRLGDLST